MLGCEIFHRNILNSSTPVCKIFNDCSLRQHVDFSSINFHTAESMLDKCLHNILFELLVTDFHKLFMVKTNKMIKKKTGEIFLVVYVIYGGLVYTYSKKTVSCLLP